MSDRAKLREVVHGLILDEWEVASRSGRLAPWDLADSILDAVDRALASPSPGTEGGATPDPHATHKQRDACYAGLGECSCPCSVCRKEQARLAPAVPAAESGKPPATKCKPWCGEKMQGARSFCSDARFEAHIGTARIRAAGTAPKHVCSQGCSHSLPKTRHP